MHSDSKRELGRVSIKTYLCVQIELDKWQNFSWKSSWRVMCLQVALSRDVVPPEGEMREVSERTKWRGIISTLVAKNVKKIKSREILVEIPWILLMSVQYCTNTKGELYQRKDFLVFMLYKKYISRQMKNKKQDKKK